MKRKKNSGGGGANWMDTYGDMVTLLLCFFVLLYSISSVDQEKWIALVRSFNPDATETMTESSGDNGPIADEDIAFQEAVNEAIEELYAALSEYAAENEQAKDIEVTKGDGYVFVSFNEAVFFDGDSYVLRPEGEDVLATVSDMLSGAKRYIDEVRIMGHTAQATPDTPNDPMVDRFLASNRAAIATVYIQEHSTLDPARIVSVGYGQHRPVDSNDTEESRSHNRRVEIIITGYDVTDTMGDSIQQYYSLRDGTYTTDSTTGSTTTEPTEESTSPAP